MQKKLLQVFEHAESDRKMLLEALNAHPANLLKSQFGNKWSINQILLHLAESERVSLSYMKKKSLGINNAGETGVLEEVKMILLVISQRLPLKYSAPSILKSDPAILPLNIIEAQWNEIRNEVKIFLEQFTEKDLNKKIYKHPAVGRLNIIHAIRFFREHVQHHIPQIKKNLLHQGEILNKH